MCEKCFHGETKFLTAANWDDGYRLMKSGEVDVAIIDLTLPPQHKEETLAKIMAEFRTLPPIVILTANDDPALPALCINSGAEDFLNKRDVNRHPEVLCERAYYAYLRRNRHAKTA